MKVKPFVKWAGGKSQLLEDIRLSFPSELGTSISRYCEPFVGGGAVLFDVLSSFDFKEVLINDINAELINVYQVVKSNVHELIKKLELYQDEFWPLDELGRREYYYQRRNEFNSITLSKKGKDKIKEASLFIFLNKTCFNGLYRVNKKGQFNVPIGSYKKPLISDKDNLLNISILLKDVTIRQGDYKECIDFAGKDSFFYLDPPYRPLSATSSFTSYSKYDFSDEEQVQLKLFIDEITKKGSKILLSNSDPKFANANDCFFDSLYREYEISRVIAKRMINCDGKSRGNVSELLISSYLGETNEEY